MNSIRDVFAHNLRQIRKGRKLTQNQFAEAIRIPLSTLQKYEGGTIPQEESLRELVAKLGVASETELFLDPDLIAHPDPESALAALTKFVMRHK